jgi:hypothetical protein
MDKLMKALLVFLCFFIIIMVIASNLNSAKLNNAKYRMPWIPLLLLSDSSKPISGKWAGPSNFGRLEFNVGNNGKEIDQIKFVFSDFSCGEIVRNGTITNTVSILILKNQFSYTTTFSPDFEMTIIGQFYDSGDFASGTWESLSYGTTCRGIWQALPG